MYDSLRWPGGRRNPKDNFGLAFLLSMALPIGGIVLAVGESGWWGLLSVVGLVAWFRFSFLRNREIGRAIEEQLTSRTVFPDEAWGQSDRLKTARFLASLIAKACHWPNDHFIPQDPTEILFFDARSDTPESWMMGEEMELKFGKGAMRKIRWWEAKTFGSLVDLMPR
jgi:hypothetical protein